MKLSFVSFVKVSQNEFLKIYVVKIVLSSKLRQQSNFYTIYGMNIPQYKYCIHIYKISML